MTANTNIKVTLTPEIRLEQALNNVGIDDPRMVTGLHITGIITYDDTRYIRKNMRYNLQELDMGNASFKENKIPNKAFYNCCWLISIIIPDSVTKIGKNAFDWCYGLTSIIIPASVTKIGESAFNSCRGLTSIIIPDSVKKIGDCAFRGCEGLTSIIIPASVTEIGESAFYNCCWLTSIIISDSVKKIGKDAFNSCDKLISIKIPNSVKEIGKDAFEYCDNLTAITVHPDNLVYSSENGVLFNKDKTKLLYYPRGRQGDYIIPDSVIEVGEDVFYTCKNLTSIKIPDSVKEIGDDPFVHCDNLTTITVHPNNPVYSSENGVLFNKDKTKLLCYPGGRQSDYVIPDSVTKIGEYSFKLCENLTSITIPDSVKEIGEAAFDGCHELTSITIPDSVKKIGKDAFNGCNNLISIKIPNSVKEIGEDAFEYCDNLTTITVHPNNPVYSSENGVLFNKDKTKLLCYPGGRQGNYVIPDSVTEIGEYAFSSCYELSSITIPDSVTKIGKRAFEYCGLKSVFIPASILHIGENAFLDTNEETEEGDPAFIIVDKKNPVYESKNGEIKERKIKEITKNDNSQINIFEKDDPHI